jgi:hypothetical protein
MKLAEQQFAVKVQRNERVLASPSDAGCLGHGGSVAESLQLMREETYVDARPLSMSFGEFSYCAQAEPASLYLECYQPV